MLAGTRNLNLQSGANNPRSALFNAFGNVYVRDGVYTGRMPALSEYDRPMRYRFVPSTDNPMVGDLSITYNDGYWDDYPTIRYDLSNLPFRAQFNPVMRNGRAGTAPVMRLVGDRVSLLRGTGDRYLDIFGPDM
jgi:hypothetical protein